MFEIFNYFKLWVPCVCGCQCQRKLAKKVKFSSNWKKQKDKLQKLYYKISNIRKDFLHKSSDAISKKYAVVVMEDLKVSNMSKSASGTIDAPGRNVAAKSGLNKSILDQGWFEFRRQLGYKLDWRGGNLLVIPPQYTSQACSQCGCVDKENRKTQAKFKCTVCGFEANADYNAAINILRVGLGEIAPLEPVQDTTSESKPDERKASSKTVEKKAKKTKTVSKEKYVKRQEKKPEKKDWSQGSKDKVKLCCYE